MHVEDNTSAPNDSELTTEIVSTGGVSTLPTYDIPEADRAIADSILKMDPLRDVPSPHILPAGWIAPPLRITALPPEMQAEVRDRLAGLGRVTPQEAAAKESQFVADAIRSRRGELVAQIGVGRDALPYHRELAGIAGEYRSLARDYDRLTEQLEEVVRHDTRTDPVTGKAAPVPVYAVDGPRRQGLMNQQADLVRHMSMLQRADGTFGIEGAKRMKQALFESVALIKGRQQQAEDAAEAKRRAEHMAREKRINRQAEAFARMQDSPD